MRSEHEFTVSVTEAAELTGLTPKAIRNRLDRDQLRCVKVGRERRIPRSELERAGLVLDAELRRLQRENEDLRAELVEHRRLIESAEAAAERRSQAERQAQEQLTIALAEQRAAATQASAQLVEQRAEVERQRAEAERLRVAALGGWLERRRARRELRR